MVLARELTDAILANQGIRPPMAAAAGAAGESGMRYTVTIGGHTNSAGKKIVSLSNKSVSYSWTCPLTPSDIETFLTRIRARHTVLVDEAASATLRKLLSRAARMFEEENISSFRMAPVRLGAHDYEIGGVQILRALPRRAGA